MALQTNSHQMGDPSSHQPLLATSFSNGVYTIGYPRSRSLTATAVLRSVSKLSNVSSPITQDPVARWIPTPSRERYYNIVMHRILLQNSHRPSVYLAVPSRTSSQSILANTHPTPLGAKHLRPVRKHCAIATCLMQRDGRSTHVGCHH